jgi:SagB-type dehydrogenase family enzyme
MNTKRLIIRLFLLVLIVPIILLSACAAEMSEYAVESPAYAEHNEALAQIQESQMYYFLPLPKTDGDMSVEQALANRRSHRNFQNRAISTCQLSQILWAAYGITLPMPDVPNLRGGLRTTPSAGATFPLEIYVVVGNVEGIEPGIFRYISEEHKLIRIAHGDVRNELSEAALGQWWVGEAPITVFYSAVFSRTTGRYGERGIRYVYIELGHSAQNIYLQAEALGLGTVAIGAFDDSRVRQILNLPAYEEPLYLIPIGYFIWLIEIILKKRGGD